jgi:hypothetical protein
MCPFCCEDIETGEDYELWLGPGPLDGMTLHSRCAAQKVFADEQAAQSKPSTSLDSTKG